MYKYLTKLSVCLLACVMLLGFAALPARAAVKEDVDSILESFPKDQWPAPPELNSQAAVIMEVNTGVMLYAKNATASSFPASTTKIMTGLLAVENCSMSDVVTVSQKAISSLTPGSSHIGLKAGEQLTVQQCMYGLLLPSANEVAYALAEQVSGNVKEFAALMNARAAELGCVNTHFTNPSGLHDEGHYTTARDLAIIGAAAMEREDFRRIVSAESWQSQDTGRSYVNKNKTLFQYDGGNGIKIGYTKASGRTLAASAERDGKVLIAVVLNDHNWFEDAYGMLDYGFEAAG